MQISKSLSSYDVLLMIDRKSSALYPFSAHGFHFAQGSLSSVRARSESCLFLDAGGQVLRLTGLRDARSGLVAAVQRSIGRPYELRVDLETVAPDMDELRQWVVDGLRTYQSTLDQDDDWAIAHRPMAEIEAAVAGAADPQALYRILELPGPEDCLDLL